MEMRVPLPQLALVRRGGLLLSHAATAATAPAPAVEAHARTSLRWKLAVSADIPVSSKWRNSHPLILSTGLSRRPPIQVQACESVSTSSASTSTSAPAVSEFEVLGLPSALVSALANAGLTQPTDIQAAAIPTLVEGRDAAVQGYTGSGKTLAYLLPALAKLTPADGSPIGSDKRRSSRSVEVAVIVPSRELAMQIVREVQKLLPQDIESQRLVQQLIGGASMLRQEKALKQNKPLIVVGTVGRVSELVRSKKLATHGIQTLILDEADKLLDPEYRRDLECIVRACGMPSQRQTVLVSATMPAGIMKAAAAWGRDPLHIKLGRGSDTEQLSQPDSSTSSFYHQHFFVIAPRQHKVDTLRRCIHALGVPTALVFLNYSRRLKDVQGKLEGKGMAVGALSGEMDKVSRGNVLTAFRQGVLQVLLVSEVAARGLDVPECGAVFNLELPTDGVHYAHRAGRTGRLGREGTVVSICEPQEAFVMQKFAKQLGISFDRVEVMGGEMKVIPKTSTAGSSPRRTDRGPDADASSSKSLPAARKTMEGGKGGGKSSSWLLGKDGRWLQREQASRT
eukprot:jgi/Chlat1/512/Chrsp103S01108